MEFRIKSDTLCFDRKQKNIHTKNETYGFTLVSSVLKMTQGKLGTPGHLGGA